MISFLGQKVQLSNTRWPLEAIQTYIKVVSPDPQQAIKNSLWKGRKAETRRKNVGMEVHYKKVIQSTNKKDCLFLIY